MADTQTSSKDSVRQRKGTPTASTQLFLDIAEIKDNVVVLKNGGIRAILQTSSVNFNLKSEQEQNATIYSYQNFLNSLEFPIQIVVQSRKLDIGEKNENPLLKQQTSEYCDYIQRLIEYADIMEKKFYVIVPYDPYRAQNPNPVSRFMSSVSAQDSVDNIKRRHKEFEELGKKLSQRVATVKAGLDGCNLRSAQLETPQLIELFYQIYNPVTARNEKIKNIDNLDLKTL